MVPLLSISIVLTQLLFITPYSSAFVVTPSIHRWNRDLVLLESTAAKKKKKPTNNGPNKGGFASPSSSSNSKTPFDASSALIRSAKLYDEISLKASKVLAASASSNDDDDNLRVDADFIHSEYLIAARLTTNTNTPYTGSAALADWVPVAQLCLLRKSSTLQDETTPIKKYVHAAVSTYCREIHYAAQTVAPIFQSFPRNHIQYSAEPLDSFFKYVYDKVLEQQPNNNKDEPPMTKAQAREILNIPIESTNDLSTIKKSYRTLSMQYHPDTISATNDNPDGDDVSAKFRQVRLAYDTLISGIRVQDSNTSTTSSWYESLGGRDRNEFFHVPQLLSPDQARKEMEDGIQSAVIGLDSETVMAFVARNIAASRS